MDLTNHLDPTMEQPLDMPEIVRPPESPEDFFEWLWRVKEFEHDIYVMDEIDGERRPVALSSLPPRRWAFWVATWWENSMVPIRIMQDAEGGDQSETESEIVNG